MGFSATYILNIARKCWTNSSRRKIITPERDGREEWGNAINLATSFSLQLPHFQTSLGPSNLGLHQKLLSRFWSCCIFMVQRTQIKGQRFKHFIDKLLVTTIRWSIASLDWQEKIIQNTFFILSPKLGVTK